MARLLRRLSAWMVLAHPPAWRRRYAAEVLALLDATPQGWLAVVDLGRSALGQWGRAWWRAAALAPSERPGGRRLGSLFLLTYAAFFGAGLLVAVGELLRIVVMLIAADLPERALAEIQRAWRYSPGFMNLVAGAPFFLIWFVLPGAAVAAALHLTGVGRRFLWPSRAAVVVAFTFVAVWLLPLAAIGGALVAGVVFAVATLPATQAAGRDHAPFRVAR